MQTCSRRPFGWGLLLGLVVVLLGGLPPSASAQEALDRTVLASFRDAQALAVDPMGRLYVADAGRDVVRILNRDGTVRGTLGGAGTRAGEFDGPADVDPTNGQSIWVADAGNGRLQRFSEEGLYLEALPVGASFREGREQRAFDDGRDGATVQGDGRPVAVATSSGGETFAIDGRNGVVLKWDEQRRPERLIGPVGRRGRTLRNPVALALDGTRRLYVADRDHEAVLAFDLFGSFVERLDTPSLPNLQALTMHRGRLWIVCPERVFVWTPDPGTTTEHALDLPAPLVDVAGRGNDLFALTSTRLYRLPFW